MATKTEKPTNVAKKTAEPAMVTKPAKVDKIVAPKVSKPAKTAVVVDEAAAPAKAMMPVKADKLDKVVEPAKVTKPAKTVVVEEDAERVKVVKPAKIAKPVRAARPAKITKVAIAANAAKLAQAAAAPVTIDGATPVEAKHKRWSKSKRAHNRRMKQEDRSGNPLPR